MNKNFVKLSLPMGTSKRLGLHSEFTLENGRLEKLLTDLVELHPKAASFLFEKPGKLQRYIQIFVNGRNTKLLDGLNTYVDPGSSVKIITAIAGG